MMKIGQYVPLVTAVDADDGSDIDEQLDEKIEEIDRRLPEEVSSVLETLRPIVVKHGQLGTLSLVAGGWAVLKGLGALRKSPARAVKQLTVGAAWIAIGRAQQQASDEDPEAALREDVAEFEESVDEEFNVGTDGNGDEDEPKEEESGVIAESNAQEPRDFGNPGTGDTPESAEQGAGEEAEIAGPSSGDAVPENTKEGGSEGHPADDVEMVDADEDDLNEGSLQSDEEEEDVASDEPDTDDESGVR
ncbi:hypothetical protein [Halalkalicoccus ordinarius]|uniref:hypothetical protein n=1 Tax=Halalkalicoccus ordinarius TaxID=3116651 RepID=UPI00300F40F5